MDQTNRLLIVSAALIWIFLVLLVVLLAWGAPDGSINKLSDFTGYLDKHNDTPARLIITFAGLILALLGSILVVYEIAPQDGGNVRVDKVGGGDVRIGTDEVSQRLEEELRSLPKLLGVQAIVVPRGNKAEVRLDLYVSSDSDLAVISEEACRRARELVGGKMGIALDCDPRAQVHYRELLVARPAPATLASSPFSSQPASPPTPAWTPERPAAAAGPTTVEPAHEATETAQQDHPTSA
jgi:hypothetical protein